MAAKGFPELAALLLIVLIRSVQCCEAQQRLPVVKYPAPAISTEAVLQQMTQAAGVIFAGEVVAVRRPAGFAGSGQDASEGVVTIAFRVDEAVRGCTAGSIFTVREWAGSWAGVDRYRVGQRLLVFLHDAGNEGLSSPVGGQAGLVPLRGGGQAPGPYDTGTGASEWLADLRWVQLLALREGRWVTGAETVWRPKPIHSRPRWDIAGDGGGTAATDPFLPVSGESGHWAVQPLASGAVTRRLSQLLGLCRVWVRAADGAF